MGTAPNVLPFILYGGTAQYEHRHLLLHCAVLLWTNALDVSASRAFF
jgi:hypothetical protein